MSTFALLGLAASGLFTGAALYVNAAEQPARLGLEPLALLAEWKPAYRNGTLMQAPLAVVGFLLGAAAWWQVAQLAYLVAGLAMIANLPWTFLVIFPTNRKLESTPVENADDRTRALVVRWGRLHAVRTGFGFLAMSAFVAGLLQSN
jgi:hypothetical protein